MIPEARIVEIERRLEGQGLTLDRLDSRVAAQEQLGSQLSSTVGGIPGMSAAGTYWADPESTTINPGAAELLEVWEVGYGGDTLVGERMVINRYPDATQADARLILSRNRDGSYTVIGQGCATGGG